MEQQKLPNQSNNKGLRKAAKFSGIAIQMGLTIYLGNLLGAWLDEKYTTSFWENTITLLAVFLSMYGVIRQAIQMNK